MRRQSTGLVALFVVGGYLLWRYRFRIQQFLESRGIDVPIDTSNVGEMVGSSVAKISGNVEHATRQASGY